MITTNDHEVNQEKGIRVKIILSITIEINQPATETEFFMEEKEVTPEKNTIAIAHVIPSERHNTTEIRQIPEAGTIHAIIHEATPATTRKHVHAARTIKTIKSK